MSPWPREIIPVGDSITAVVLGAVDLERQVDLSTRRSDLAGTLSTAWIKPFPIGGRSGRPRYAQCRTQICWRSGVGLDVGPRPAAGSVARCWDAQKTDLRCCPVGPVP